jgi:hypothetical protein
MDCNHEFSKTHLPCHLLRLGLNDRLAGASLVRIFSYRLRFSGSGKISPTTLYHLTSSALASAFSRSEDEPARASRFGRRPSSFPLLSLSLLLLNP